MTDLSSWLGHSEMAVRTAATLWDPVLWPALCGYCSILCQSFPIFQSEPSDYALLEGTKALEQTSCFISISWLSRTSQAK